MSGRKNSVGKNGGHRRGKKAVDLDRVFADGRFIDRALRASISDAILEHKRLGLPIAEWSFEENRVVWTPAEKLPVDRPKKRSPGRRRTS